MNTFFEKSTKLSQKSKPAPLLILIVMLLTLVFPSEVLFSQEITLQDGPLIKWGQTRVPSGKHFSVKISVPSEKKSEVGNAQLYFLSKGKNAPKVPVKAFTKSITTEGKREVYEIQGLVPEYENIFPKTDKRKWYEGWLIARSATLEIQLPFSSESHSWQTSFAIPLQKMAALWGLAVLLIFLVLFLVRHFDPFPKDERFKSDERAEKWNERHQDLLKRLVSLPLKYSITPIGTYSISLAQIQFWTAIVIFASVYVFITRGEFLNVSEQVLMLLGISGGTALAAKINAATRRNDEIPHEYLKEIEKRRLPRFRDLVSVRGAPNLFKFQIFAFTLLSGVVVLQQLYQQFDFPEIPAGQLMLMGLSSGVYLGHEFGMEDTWKNIHETIKKADEARSNNNQAKFDELKKRIIGRLKDIYE